MPRERLTEELLERLLASASPEAYLAQGDTVDRSLPDYLSDLLKRRGMRRADVVKEVVNLFGGKKTKAVTEWIEKCLDLAIAENRIMLTVDDIMTT